MNFGSSLVNIVPEKTSVRFLGVWINSSRSPTFVKSQARKDINNFVATMRPKHLTDKQIAYIVNMVLCPILEYRLQCTPLSKNECNQFFGSIRSLFKKNSKFASTLPSTLLHSNMLYNLNDLWSLQCKSFATSLLNQFNSQDLYYKVSKIRLFQLQTNSLLSSSPLFFWKHPFDRSSHKNLIGAQLSILHSIADGFKPVINETLKNQIVGGSHSLYDLLPYTDFKSNLKIIKKFQLFYLDQLISLDGQHLITWNDL